MALIVPFRGMRFNPEKTGRLDDVVTPPYDVIDEDKQAAFKARNPYNMIQLDLSKNPGPAVKSDERYQQARRLFEEWRAAGVLIRDELPSIYFYQIDYAHPFGPRLTRKGLVCLVRLEDFASGVVRPHEDTFGTVTADRLRLLEACQAQFSQIFSIYSDADGEIINCLEGCRAAEPLCAVRDADGARHTIWPVTDQQALKRVQELFKDKPVYIADGHHRYSTSLNYRKMLEKSNGGLAPDSPYNYAMMYLCPTEDPGLAVLPTHRLLLLPVDVVAGGQAMSELLRRLAPGFHIEEIYGGSRESLVGEVLTRMDEKINSSGRETTILGLYQAGEDRCFMLTMKEGMTENAALAGRPPVMRTLDVVVLSDLVIGNYLGLGKERIENENLIRYFSDPDEALDVAVKESINNENVVPVLFFMNHTRVSQVMKVADEKLVMPHKSTFFYPKILTGLLINRLVREEKAGL